MDNLNFEAARGLLTEIKLYINDRLYKKGHITEAMNKKAQEIIIKESRSYGLI